MATGYYGQHNTLKVEDADLPKVPHYFKGAHPHFDQDVIVIGGENSAIDTALELERAGANMMVLCRGGDYPSSIKPWILPNLTVLINHEKIGMEFNANVTQITEDIVTYGVNGESEMIHNDYAFATIGYHPDYEFLKSVDIQINTNEFGTALIYSKETYETSIENCYIAGVIVAGNDANTIFIENGKFHGGIIAQSTLARKQAPLKS